MEIREYTSFSIDEVLALYSGAGWTSYTERAEVLEAAYARSLCVLGAYDGGRLVGILRAVGDGLTILFIQDIIVAPEYRRRGIGTALLNAAAERYPSVYQTELLTDDTESAQAFYRSAGFVPVVETGCAAFIKM